MDGSCQFVALSVMHLYHLPLHLLCVAELVRTSAGAPVAGHFLAYVSKLVPCSEDESNGNIVWRCLATPFNIKEPYTLQRLTGNVTYRRPFDDTYWSRVRIDSRSSDGQRWLKNAFVISFPGKACSTTREHMPSFARLFLGEGAFMSGKPCVVQPGVITMENQPVNWTFPHFPIMPYGYMRFHQTMGRGREVDYCQIAEFHSIPRPKQGNNG
ncbi:uncharacterized protein LOC127749409 [Frankliniella occidentalis]|uniref:Uncharacterized protein LOC127749409 n=1 Tax=Frankliniella occidentalis TaxID=133901 RepID=A0A9C6TZR5_FRAOC|nr:uncharacterized protein LOC127749409 [Frankliniella occidentalis]